MAERVPRYSAWTLTGMRRRTPASRSFKRPNEYDPNSIANLYGAGSPFSPSSVTNEFGIYGSPFSDQSATNPYATDAPRLYDQEGNYRGKLSTNQYDPDSVSNPTADMAIRIPQTRSIIRMVQGIRIDLIAPPTLTEEGGGLKGNNIISGKVPTRERRG